VIICTVRRSRQRQPSPWLESLPSAQTEIDAPRRDKSLDRLNDRAADMTGLHNGIHLFAKRFLMKLRLRLSL
jgi:hypothetical protein